MAITFVTPHQRVNSGGVHMIERFAVECARHMPVTVVVMKGEPRDLPGVSVVGPSALQPDAAPDADWIVVPADSQAFADVLELPDSKGAPVLFLQGYGTPGNPVVVENLRRAQHVLAGAEWLVDEARGAGCTAELVRYGLDRDIFFSSKAERDLTVGMMAGSVDWKGTADGIAALEMVRERIPDVAIRLFGRDDPGLPGASFLAAPPATRTEIAELMRVCSVFVVSSWEEGFGLPGIEAISCGCALATTDTKGSRDYAFDGETALVSPPHDPSALAENVVRLLGDPRLRTHLVERGNHLLMRRYPAWAEAGDAFVDALARLAPPG